MLALTFTQQPIRLRVRVTFTVNGQQVVIQEEVCPNCELRA